MNGYRFSIGCLHCEAPLEHTAGCAGHPRMQSVIAACTACGSQYRLNVELLVLNGPAIRETLSGGGRSAPYRGRSRPVDGWPTWEELQDKPGSAALPWQDEVDAVLRADDAEIAAERKERKRLERLSVSDVLVCDECGWSCGVVDGSKLLADHTQSIHYRRPTVVERTPRNIAQDVAA